MKRTIWKYLTISIMVELLICIGTYTYAQTIKLTNHQLNLIAGNNAVGTNCILFISDRDGQVDLYKMGLDGSNPTNVYTIKIDGTELRQISPANTLAFDVDWSSQNMLAYAGIGSAENISSPALTGNIKGTKKSLSPLLSEQLQGYNNQSNSQSGVKKRDSDIYAIPFGTPTTQKEWTFMVYLDGDNDLEGAAIDDFMEMAQIGSNDKVNIVVQMDRAPGYNSAYENWTECHRFLITQEMTPIPSNAISDWGDGKGGREVNMGNPTTLLEFINWTTTNYPAQKYALIFWNHGSGWRAPKEKKERPKKAICWDESDDNDCLYMSEVRQAIGSATVHRYLIGFDVCYGGMVEVAYALRGLCDVMVASEEAEPEDGWPYDTILADLVATSTMSAMELGEVIVKRYKEYYESRFKYDTTQSAVDMNKLNNLVTAIDTFADSMNWPATHTNWQKIAEARGNILAYGEDEDPPYHGIDIYYFADKVQNLISDTTVKDASAQVKTNLTSAIIANYRGFELDDDNGYGSYGLAIYFPKNLLAFNSDSQHYAYEETNTIYPVDYVIDHRWDNFLHRFYNSAITIYVSENGNDITGNGLLDNPYKTIQKGIDMAPPLGVILVLPGTYTESIFINKKVSVVGSGTPTIIAPAPGENVVTFSTSKANKAQICGFRIQGASGSPFYDSGIYCAHNADPIIKNNIITGNDKGITCYSSSPTIRNNIITYNNEYGIYSYYYSSPSVIDNLIAYNGENGIGCSDSSQIINNRIIRNKYDGIQYYASLSKDSMILNNIIMENGRDGICCSSGSPFIVNNVIAGNNCGISCFHSSIKYTPFIINNTIVKNIQHGIYLYSNYTSGGGPTIINNIIVNNGTSSTEHWGIYRKTGGYDISYNNLWNNGLSGTQNYYNCTSTTGEISVDPLFVGEDDYHLQGMSQCIDKGLNSAFLIIKEDIEGNPRISNEIVDLGAYEYQGPHILPGTITGVISGTTTQGTLIIRIYSSPIMEGTPIKEVFIPNPIFPYTYTVSNLYPETYYIMAFIDIDGDTKPTVNEPIGVYGTLSAVYIPWQIKGTPTPVVVDSDLVTYDIDIELTHKILSLQIISSLGNNQVAQVSTILTPFVAKLIDNFGTPVEGYTIEWKIIYVPSLATLSSTITITNQEGLASTTLTLGTKAGTYMVIAQGSLLIATFTAKALPGSLTQISISTDSPYVAVNQQVLFIASGYDQYHNEVGELIYNWEIEGDIGSLSTTIGTFTILHATLTPTVGTISAGTQGITGSTKVLIVYGQLTNAIITPTIATIEMLGTQSFTAQGFNQYSSSIPETIYTWTLTPQEIGTLNTTTAQTVVFTATKPGTAYLIVKAKFETHAVTATATITVLKGNVHYIHIVPTTTTTIEARGTAGFTAKAFNQHGYELTEVTNFVWEIIKGSGTVKGSPGQTLVLQTNDVIGTGVLSATINTVTGTITFEVIHGNINRIGITTQPTPFEIEVTKQGTLTAHAYNRFDHEIPEPICLWELIPTQLGQLSTTTATSVVFTGGTKTGIGVINATCGGKTSTTTVIVTPGPVEKLAFGIPTVGTLSTGMPGTITILMQDKFGNLSPTNTTVIVTGDNQSRFASLALGVPWTVTGTFTIVGTSSKIFFFKQIGTTTPVIIMVTFANISITYSVTISPLSESSFGAIVGDDGKTNVEIKIEAISEAGYIEIDTSGTSTTYPEHDDVIEANKKDDLDLKMNRVEETLRKFVLHNGTITPGIKIRISIPYSDADDDKYVDEVTPPMRVSSLKVYKLVGTGTLARWEEIPSWVDEQNKVVCADVSELSIFILMGPGFEPNLEKAFVYPNPYYADRHADVGINFDRLTENSTIQIFTIAGELVKEIQAKNPCERWDVRNEAREKVASGIYIYLIKDPAGNKNVGKLGVIR